MEVRKHRRAEPIAMTEDSAAVKHGSRPLNRHAGRFEPQEFPTTPWERGPARGHPEPLRVTPGGDLEPVDQLRSRETACSQPGAHRTQGPTTTNAR